MKSRGCSVQNCVFNFQTPFHFTETELRIKFLQCRDTYLQYVLDQVPNADPQNHLAKIIEHYRVHLFDIITQYKAIFSDDDQFNLYSGINDSGNEDEDQQPAESALFYNWVNEKIGQFLEMLRIDLAKGSCAFDTVLSQCMYFGLSFSRVGADFRPLMVPIILNAIQTKFSNHCLRAKEQLSQTLGAFSIKDVNDSGHNSVLSSTSKGYESGSTFSSSVTTQPPIEIASLGPLALFCNSLVVAMNDLRSCCPVSLASFVGQELNEILSAASNLIKKWVDEQHQEQIILIQVTKTENHEKNEEETINQAMQLKVAENNVLSAARRMSTTLESLILFIQKVLSAFFPSSQLCQKLACGAQELVVLKAGRVNPSECILSLKDYLPTDEDILLTETVVVVGGKSGSLQIEGKQEADKIGGAISGESGENAEKVENAESVANSEKSANTGENNEKSGNVIDQQEVETKRKSSESSQN